MSYDQTFQKKQRDELANAMKDPQFCDVTFVIGPQSIKFETNRTFLAICSPVFKAMLFGSMSESKPKSEIIIKDIDAKAFNCVLKHSYRNDPELSPSNVAAVRRIADKYSISLLAEHCDAYFQTVMSSKTLCTLLSSAIKWKLEDWIQECGRFLSSWSAYDILESDGFLNMSFEALQTLLESDDLSANETSIWDAVLRWIDHRVTVHEKEEKEYEGLESFDENKDFEVNVMNRIKRMDEMDEKCEQIEDRITLIKRICPFIRFGLMSGKYFVEKVVSQNFLSVQEIADISCFIHWNGYEYKGRFSTTPRTPPLTLLQYTIESSAEDELEDIGFLQSNDLRHYAYVANEATMDPWLEIIFESYQIPKRLEIAAPLTADWGADDLNGCKLQYFVNAYDFSEASEIDEDAKIPEELKWIDVMSEISVESGKIRRIEIRSGDLSETRRLRIMREGKGYLAVGCLRIYGCACDDGDSIRIEHDNDNDSVIIHREFGSIDHPGFEEVD